MQMAFDARDEAASDEALLAGYAAGDPRAARLLTDRMAPRIFAFALRMLAGDRAEAEDVTQEAMLRLWRIAPRWRPGEAKPSTWLFRVAANLCTDRLRKRRMLDIDGVAEPADGAPGAVEGLIAANRAEALEIALGMLPERQRQAVVLRHLEGFSNPEIAEVMEVSVEAVESLTARGKRTLAELLAPQRDKLGYQDG